MCHPHAKTVPIVASYGAHFSAFAKINGPTSEIYAKPVRFMILLSAQMAIHLLCAGDKTLLMWFILFFLILTLLCSLCSPTVVETLTAHLASQNYT